MTADSPEITPGNTSDTTEPTEEVVDVRNNRESRSGARDSLQHTARASDGGAPPTDAPWAGEQPDADPDGTAGGDPLAGLTTESREEPS